MNRHLPVIVPLFLAAALSFARPASVTGQAARRGGDADEERLRGNLFIPNRLLSQRLKKAEELLEAADYAPALELLQSVIDAPEDFLYFPDASRKSRFVSHAVSQKKHAMRLLEQLPQEGSNIYEIKYGRRATSRLDDALAAGDVSAVEQIARRFFHSEAGYRATYYLGSFHLDRGRPLAAAMHFERLRAVSAAAAPLEPALSLKTALAWSRAGNPEQAAGTLIEMKRASAGSSVMLAGRRVPFFQSRERALPWLAALTGEKRPLETAETRQWTVFRGNARRNAASSPAAPVWDRHWELETFRVDDSEDHFDPQKRAEAAAKTREAIAELHSLESKYRRGSFLALPAAHPLVVGDLVVVRTFNKIRALDRRDGRLRWQSVAADPAYRNMVEGDGNVTVSRSGRGRIVVSNTAVSQPPRQVFLTQRAWRDVNAGTLSSDGRYIYAVEELDFSRPVVNRRTMPGQELPGLSKGSKLRCYDLDGRMKWDIGGDDPDHPLPLDGTFFLGPPLPLGERLYCIAEVAGEIRLLVLEIDRSDPHYPRPKLVWRQGLVQPEDSVRHYPLRRMSGVSPSHADGVMVCPTTAGAVVAIDLPRRVMLWGYLYPTNTPQQNANNNPLAQFRSYVTVETDGEDRWLDSAATIADGRVVLTPRDSNELHCLSLLDGSVVWKKPRGQGLYVACVHAGNVIVVGRTQVEAYRLEDGEEAWRQSVPVEMPSGRGVRVGHLYHLPVYTGEPDRTELNAAAGAAASAAANHVSAGAIVTLDLRTGRVLARTETPSGRAAGNLVSAGGTLVSQTIDSVSAFRPTDEIEQLVERLGRVGSADQGDSLVGRAHPALPGLLALRGEMRLHRGDEAAGLADLRRAYMLQESPRTAETIVATLLDGLRFDYASYRAAVPEIERLLTGTAQRAKFLRLQAAGLQQIGALAEAFDRYLELAKPVSGGRELQRIHGLLEVRSDRWVQSALAAIYRAASPREKAEMDRRFAEQFESAKEAGRESLEEFLDAFLTLPPAEEARIELTRRLNEPPQSLKLELHLLELLDSSDRETAGYAAARLVRLLLERRQPDAALAFLGELEGCFADVVCLDGQTGRELAAGFREHKDLAGLLAASRRWPDRRLQAEWHRGASSSYRRLYPVDFEGPRGMFRGWSFVLDQSRHNVLARDPAGVVRWQVSVRGSSRRSSLSYYGNSVRAHGHLVVITAGTRFFVIDAFSSSSPRLLWQKELYEIPAGMNVNRTVRRVQQVALPGGGRRFVMSDPLGRPLGEVGPITAETLIYQVGTSLYAADPLSGETLWVRHNVPRGSRLAGGGDLLFVTAPGSNRSMVLRMIDGREQGVQPAPEGTSRLLSVGGRILSWQSEGAGRVLEWTDLASGKAVWRREFAEKALFVVLEDDEVAVVEPQGRFRVLTLADGRVKLDAPIDPLESLHGIVVRRSAERYVLLTYAETSEMRPIPYTSQTVSGPAYAFSRADGGRLWKTTVTDQSIDDSQPQELPFLVLASYSYQRVQQRTGFNYSYKLAVNVLDARTGSMVLITRDSQPSSGSGYDMEVDPEGKTAQVRFYRASLDVALSDEPLPPRESGN